MANLSQRLKKLEQFEYSGSKLWIMESADGTADAWTGELLLAETAKVIDRITEPMTMDELMAFKEASKIGMLISVGTVTEEE